MAGISAYAFLVISARALGTDEYAPLSVLWALVFLAGPGFFLPLEQEVGRALAARRTRGEGGAPVVARTALLGVILLGGLLVLALVLHRPLVDGLFSGNTVLLWAWLLALTGSCAGHVARGTLSGQGRFAPYARYIGGEASSRALMCAGLALFGVSTVGPYGLVVGIAPFIALALALAGQRDLLRPGPVAPWSEISTALAALLVGSVLAMGLVNAGPLAIEVLAGPREDAEAGRFLAGLVIARIPLFLFQAVQASLLPKLSQVASEGRVDDFRVGFRRLALALSALSVAGVVVASTLGPFVVRLLFGADFDLPHRTMGMLALGSGAFMVASAVAQANIALGGHARQAAAWAVGMAAFALAVALSSDDLYLRVEIASVASGFAALVGQLQVLRSRLRAGAAIDPDALVEAITDLPLEP
ncbi:MAG: lipopolysaccharide biosynthesis protein [Acidimicrobiia bacterium]